MGSVRRDGFPSGSVPDILAAERASSRPRFPALAFLLGRWSVGASFAALALLGFSFFWLRGASQDDAALADVSSVPVDLRRDLNPAEVLWASSFGRPLYLGDSGRPVVRHSSTGEVRELTAFEQDWNYYYPSRFTGVQDIAESPGPRGYGIWWRGEPSRQVRQSYLAFGRHDWRERQQAELRWVVGTLAESAGVLSSWHGGYAPISSTAHLEQQLAPVSERYSFVVRSGQWAQIPGRWRCDLGVEKVLTQGLTVGCPTPVYLQLVEDAWVSVGLLLEDIYQARAILELMEPLDSLAVAGSGYPEAYQLALLDVARSQDRLDAALRVLWARSAAEDLVIFVEVP